MNLGLKIVNAVINIYMTIYGQKLYKSGRGEELFYHFFRISILVNKFKKDETR